MIILFVKILMYRLYRLIGFPRILPVNYTFSLINSCNSRCKTCNVYRKKTELMSPSDYLNIFRKIGKSPFWVTISGGEVFLRKDLVDIITSLYLHCKPKIINIPTNGLLNTKISHIVKKICENCPKSQIIVNLSIDGIEEEHDRIRNVQGNYNKVIATYKSLKRLKHDNLSVGIHTVISKFNIENFPKIADTLIELKPDSYITEIAEQRVELANLNEDITPEPLQYRAAIDFLIHRIKNSSYKGMSRITQAFRIEYYNLVKEILRDQKQVISCYSGIASCQIAPNGDVWFCCIKAKSIGNLKRNNFDFRKLWFSKQASELRKEIAQGKCHCPLANASYTNMLFNLKSLSRVFYRCYIKWEK